MTTIATSLRFIPNRHLVHTVLYVVLSGLAHLVMRVRGTAQRNLFQTLLAERAS
jgi:hypothetical protein